MKTGSFRAMGAAVEWWAPAESEEPLAEWFETVEECCSRFRATSELSVMNAAKASSMRVSALMERVLRAADDAFFVSGGTVDATLLDAVEAAGYDRSFEIASRRVSGPPLNGSSWADVIVRPGRVIRPPGLRFDLGGVAKGWAAWSALELVAGEVLIDAAGDIAMRGAWAIEVEHDRVRVARLLVEDCGVATSGIDRRRWRGGHHIIDPATREPAVTDVLAATVVAETTPLAETVARSIVVRGSRNGLEWADSIEGVKWAGVTTDEGTTIALDLAEVET